MDRKARTPVRAFLSVLGVFVLSGAALATTGSAASLGGLTSADISAQSYTNAPVGESFDQPAGTNLQGTTDSCGGTWNVVGGTVQITADQKAIATAITAPTNLVSASVPLCNGGSNPNSEIGAEVAVQGNAAAGVLLHGGAGGRPSTALILSNGGTITLERVSAVGVRTTLATATTAGGNGTRLLRMSYINGVYRGYVNNTNPIVFTVPAAQRPLYEANNQIGLVTTETRTTFDNIQAFVR